MWHQKLAEIVFCCVYYNKAKEVSLQSCYFVLVTLFYYISHVRALLGKQGFASFCVLCIRSYDVYNRVGPLYNSLTELIFNILIAINTSIPFP